MTTTYLDASDAHNAARRLEAAAKQANDAADRLEESVRQLKMLVEDGYGNNFSSLLEILRKLSN